MRVPHIDVAGDKAALAQALFDAILRDIFHAPGGGTLGVQLFKGATGELALKVGESEPFGVVNVGDPAAVAEACEKRGITRLEDDQNRSSLFLGINRDDSPINLLVGARKFTEGWNSWRVSSIGLMRMGKNEGTQIIQLFGRGVRLRGYRMSLRRSSVLAEKPAPPRNLRQVETLQVFGVKADYMKKFRDWIYSEVPEAQERQVWDLPVVKTLPERKLKTLRLRATIDGETVERGQAFRKLGPLVRLRPPHETAPEDAWLRHHRTRLNWLPRIRGIAGANQQITAAVGQAADLPRQTLKIIPAFMFDIDALLFGLEAFKATRGLDRLHVDRAAIAAMLARDDWYDLLATADDMRLDRYENRSQWQRMAQQLLNAYAERLYRFVRGRWEAPYLEVAELAADDPNLVDGYTVETTDLVQTAEQVEQIATFIEGLKTAIGQNVLAAWSQWGGRWRTRATADRRDGRHQRDSRRAPTRSGARPPRPRGDCSILHRRHRGSAGALAAAARLDSVGGPADRLRTRTADRRSRAGAVPARHCLCPSPRKDHFMTTITQIAHQRKQQARAAFIDAAWAGADSDRLAELASDAGMDPGAADEIIARIVEARSDIDVANLVTQRRRAASKAQSQSETIRARVNAAVEKLEAEADAAAFESEDMKRALYESESAARRVLAVYDEGLLPAARLPKEVQALVERREQEGRASRAQAAMIAATNERDRLRKEVQRLDGQMQDLPLSVDRRHQEARLQRELEHARANLEAAEARCDEAEKALAKARKGL